MLKKIKEFIRKYVTRRDGITRINISRNEDYYTQRNNKKDPLSACNVTAAINWLKSCGIPFHYDESMQPEDYLMDILNSKEAYTVMKKLAPTMIGKYPPNQVLVMLEWGINKLVGEDVCYIKWNATLEDIAWSILREKAVITVGKYTPSGHFLTVVGFRTKQERFYLVNKSSDIDVKKIVFMELDDPYGNPLTDYTDPRGNDVVYPVNLFHEKTREYNSNTKWGFFYKGVLE